MAARRGPAPERGLGCFAGRDPGVKHGGPGRDGPRARAGRMAGRSFPAPGRGAGQTSRFSSPVATLPSAVRGSRATVTTSRGRLKRAIRPSKCASSAAGS
jgi:hypothetical protein